ncbi:MAG TPA: hypothetical protein DEA08_19680 [Planctomycetes bacterium]|nr:hypothetical protein [Planctomycetota bacterium]|tara:strand:- start:59 stop:265 length:207 start_codon:yes stop_codon:yes gene_type:complete
MADEEELSVVLNLRITPETEERLKAFAVSKSHVARTALQLGLQLVEGDPMLLLKNKQAKRGRPKKGAD